MKIAGLFSVLRSGWLRTDGLPWQPGAARYSNRHVFACRVRLHQKSLRFAAAGTAENRCRSAHKTVTNFADCDSISQAEAGGELLRQEQPSAWGGFGLHERLVVRIFYSTLESARRGSSQLFFSSHIERPRSQRKFARSAQALARRWLRPDGFCKTTASQTTIAAILGRRPPPRAAKPLGARPTGCRSNPIYLEHAKQGYPAAPALLN